MDRIKRLSTEILNEYQDKFGPDFSSNKQVLNEVSIIRSKGLKNKIAGYITKILQRKQKFEDQKQELIENEKKIERNRSSAEPSAEPSAENIAEEIINDDNSKDIS